jgi:hypothetical protein
MGKRRKYRKLKKKLEKRMLNISPLEWLDIYRRASVTEYAYVSGKVSFLEASRFLAESNAFCKIIAAVALDEDNIKHIPRILLRLSLVSTILAKSNPKVRKKLR